MKVYMLKDIERIGMAGDIINVSDGYATNFLFPKNYAKKASDKMEILHRKGEGIKKQSKIVISTKTSMLAERIKNMNISIKEHIHNDGKLYGAVGSSEIVDLLKGKGVSVSKKQIEFKKSIKAVGDYKVIIKLSSKLKPELNLKVTGLAK
jgi:large subunit ribosomal protein L9